MTVVVRTSTDVVRKGGQRPSARVEKDRRIRYYEEKED
jgi:hypothetical protein